MDVVEREAMEATAAAIEERLGPVDVLVDNAGTCVHAPALEVTQQDWRSVLDTNLDGVWNGCQV